MNKLASLSLSLGLIAAVSSGCGGPSPAGCRNVIENDITSATTWTAGGGCDYLVKGVQDVTAALKIEPGVVVQFEANAGLLVAPTGSLNAVGTAAKRITFTGAATAKGYWRGLAFQSNNPANELTNVDVLYAGSDDFCCDFFDGPGGGHTVVAAVVVGGATVDGSPSLKMTGSTIGQSGSYGLYVFNESRLVGFAGNTFRGNQKAPVSVPLSIIGALDSASVYSGVSTAAGLNDPNGEPFVRVVDSAEADTNVTQTVQRLDVPYGMGIGNGYSKLEMDYAGTLNVSAGTRFEFEANTGLRITETGKLSAVGSAMNKITFTGRTDTPGYWLGLSFRSSGNIMSHTVVSNGGGADFCCDYFTGPGGGTPVKANIVIGGAVSSGASSLSLTDSAVNSSLNYGVFKFTNASLNDSGTSYSGNATDKNF